MTDRELISRASALGVSASYLDWRKARVQVPARTLAAIIETLGQATGPGDQVGEASGPGSGLTGRAGPGNLPRVPRERSWGFTIQLYSVRSRRSWGHGDLRDLADLARWSACHFGAGFVLINPLHATEPLPPLSNSPYLPMTRRYISPLYLRIEDVAEYQQLTGVQRQAIEVLAAPLRAASATPDLLDRDRVWDAKRKALELIFEIGRTEVREADYRRYRMGEGGELAAWASWCALAEQHGPDWRRWPAELADPRRAMRLTSAGGPLAARAEFHAWLQWLADTQLADAQRAALAAGMDIGIIGDLAVGVHPGGADAWVHQDLLIQEMRVGAPPDSFNQRGQTWGQLPWHPQRLIETGARPLAELLGAACRNVGGLRVDHVMGLMRLWWVPEGMAPDEGAYVKYDHRQMVGALTAATAKAGAIAIGEDLGTIDAWIRRYLASHHVLGTELLWFAREPDGSPLVRTRWRRACLATVGTHDVPPVTGFVTGDQVAVRERLGLLKDPDGERKAAELRLSRWQSILAADEILPRGAEPTPAEFTVALYEYLARSPALLVGVSLADTVGDRRTQNIPGTSDQYPNWRVPLCDSEGKAVLIEDLSDLELLAAVVRSVTGSMAGHAGELRAYLRITESVGQAIWRQRPDNDLRCDEHTVM